MSEELIEILKSLKYYRIKILGVILFTNKKYPNSIMLLLKIHEKYYIINSKQYINNTTLLESSSKTITEMFCFNNLDENVLNNFIEDKSDIETIFFPMNQNTHIEFSTAKNYKNSKNYFDEMELLDDETKVMSMDSICIILDEDDYFYQGIHFNFKNFIEIKYNEFELLNSFKEK